MIVEQVIPWPTPVNVIQSDSAPIQSYQINTSLNVDMLDLFHALLVKETLAVILKVHFCNIVDFLSKKKDGFSDVTILVFSSALETFRKHFQMMCNVNLTHLFVDPQLSKKFQKMCIKLDRNTALTPAI